MVKLIVLVFFVLLCVYLTDQTHFLSDDYINKINKFAGTWKVKLIFLYSIYLNYYKYYFI